MNMNDNKQPSYHNQHQWGAYITYHVPQPSRSQSKQSTLQSPPAQLQQYIREHATKYDSPFNSNRSTDKSSDAESSEIIHEHQHQPLTPFSSNTTDGLQDEYEELKQKYDELVEKQKCIDNIQQKFLELEKYNNILCRQQTENVTINVLRDHISELEEVNRVQNELIQQLIGEKKALNRRSNTDKILIEAHQQNYQHLEKKYKDLVSKNELREIEMNQLEHKYKDLERKYNKNIQKLEYENKDENTYKTNIHKTDIYKTNILKAEIFTKWSAKDIVRWIVDKDKMRYHKYYGILLSNMNKEGIDGECLADLDKNDLHRLGVTQFKDKRDIYHNVQSLINNAVNIH